MYSNLGINRKNGFGKSPARYKPDERIFVGKTILLNTGGSCSGVRKKYLYIIKMLFGVYVVGKL